MSEIRKAGERAIKKLRASNRAPTSLEPRVEALELSVAKLKAEAKVLEDAIEELQEWQLDNRKAE